MSSYDDGDEGMAVNRKLSLYAHRKKQAAVDAQLLMNRIALLQKEEDRSKKKIEQTRDRALEILALRDENEKRLQDLIDATDAKRQYQKKLHARNTTLEQESRQIREERMEEIQRRKKDEALEVQEHKKTLRKELMATERLEREKKQRQRELIKKQEEEAKQRKEQERRENERRIHEMNIMKAKQEEAEAVKAEKLVRALEKKEREYIEKLRNVQISQESAFERLEVALQADSYNNNNSSISSSSKNNEGNFRGNGESTSSRGQGSSSSTPTSGLSSSRRTRSTPRLRP
eukprot:gene11531-24123_t